MSKIGQWCELLMISVVATLVGCATQSLGSADYQCSTGATISANDALRIALQAKGIADASSYELSVDQDKLFFYVSFEATREGANPSSGTVGIDYCGKVWAMANPL